MAQESLNWHRHASLFTGLYPLVLISWGPDSELLIEWTGWKDECVTSGLSLWLSGKESTCNAGVTGDTGLIPGLGRSPGGGHGNPLQYSCLVNPMDRGAWQAIVHGVTKSWTWLSKSKHERARIRGPGRIDNYNFLLISYLSYQWASFSLITCESGFS